MVNDIRTAVLGWQEDGYPGITQTSRDLINHWTDEEACQLYFAQLDAVLTVKGGGKTYHYGAVKLYH